MSYIALANYYVQPGKKEKAIKYLQETLFKSAKSAGCYELKILQGVDTNHLIGMGTYSDIDSAQNFHKELENEIKEDLQSYLEKPLEREVFEVIYQT